jgi:hypothetical protein
VLGAELGGLVGDDLREQLLDLLARTERHHRLQHAVARFVDRALLVEPLRGVEGGLARGRAVLPLVEADERAGALDLGDRDERLVFGALGGGPCDRRERGDCVGRLLEAGGLLRQRPGARGLAIEVMCGRDLAGLDQLVTSRKQECGLNATEHEVRAGLQRWPGELIGAGEDRHRGVFARAPLARGGARLDAGELAFELRHFGGDRGRRRAGDRVVDAVAEIGQRVDHRLRAIDELGLVSAVSMVVKPRSASSRLSRHAPRRATSSGACVPCRSLGFAEVGGQVLPARRVTIESAARLTGR